MSYTQQGMSMYHLHAFAEILQMTIAYYCAADS